MMERVIACSWGAGSLQGMGGRTFWFIFRYSRTTIEATTRTRRRKIRNSASADEEMRGSATNGANKHVPQVLLLLGRRHDDGRLHRLGHCDRGDRSGSNGENSQSYRRGTGRGREEWTARRKYSVGTGRDSASLVTTTPLDASCVATTENMDANRPKLRM